MKTKHFIMMGIISLTIFKIFETNNRKVIYKTREDVIIKQATELPSLFDIHD